MITDIRYWQARHSETGELKWDISRRIWVANPCERIDWNHLRFVTFCKHETMDKRPCRFFIDEVGWEADLEARHR